jgi:ligand-binding sensor domain-containing protein
MLRRCICIALYLYTLLFSQSTSAQYIFRHYGATEGLGNRSVNQILQDSYGFVWVATDHGLYRYDGHRFKGYFSIPNNHNSLPNNRIRSISLDSQGDLWIGCWGGLAKYNHTSGSIAQIDAPFTSGHDKVQNLFCDRQMRVWVATWLGLYAFDLSGKQLGHWRYGKGRHDLPHEQCNSIFQDRFGAIWIGTTGGLCRFREKTKDFEVFFDDNPAYRENNGWINSTSRLWEDSSGNLWFGGWANGLKKFDRKSHSFTSYLLKPEFAGHGAYNVITDVAWFDRKIWVASHDQGLGTFNPKTNTFDFFKNRTYPKLDIPTMLTNTLFASDNVLWIGTNNGLYAIHKEDQYISLFPLQGVRKLSCLPEVTDVVPDPFNPNGLYFSTWTCGLFYYDLIKNEPQSIPDPILNVNNNINLLHIRRMLFTHDSTHVLATSHGLYYRKPGALKFSRVKIQSDLKAMPPEDYFHTVFEDQSGQLWAGSRKGIIKIDQKTWEWKRILLGQTIEEFPGALNDIITDICETSNYIVFLRGTSTEDKGCGITLCEKSTQTFRTYLLGKGRYVHYPFAQTAWRLRSFPQTNHVLIASERGVCSFNLDDSIPNFIKFSAYHGLSSDEINTIHIDSANTVSLQSEFGLDIWNWHWGKTKISAASGLPDLSYTVVRPWNDEKVVLGFTEHYLALIDIQKALDVAHRKKGSIKLTGASTNTQALLLQDTLHLPQGTRYVKMEFSDFSFSRKDIHPYTIQRIQGNDTLTFNTNQASLEWSDLAPGFYQIRISRANSLGFIYIDNPYLWYEKPWIQLLFSGVLVAFILLLIFRIQRRVYLKKQRDNQLKLQLVEHEMKSLRTQMNDHFVFNALTGISRYIYDNDPQKATGYLSTFSKLIRLNLKSTRSSNVTLQHELEAIRWYVELESLRLQFPPALEFEIAPELNPENVLIPPMLIQPLVENAIRHGAEQVKEQITISIRAALVSYQVLQIEVLDNAPMFRIDDSQAWIEQKGLSLATQIIKERLEIMRAQNTKATYQFQVVSSDEHGQHKTIAILTLPLEYV